jgi:uncharacterized protein YkvS
MINSENKYIQTGAAVIENINDQPLIIDMKENLKDLLIDFKDKITSKLNN